MTLAQGLEYLICHGGEDTVEFVVWGEQWWEHVALPIHIMGDGEWLESSQVINLRRPTGRPNFQQAPQPPKTIPSSKDEQGPTEDILDLNLNTSLLVSFSGHFFLCPGVINVVKRGKSSKNMKTCCLTVLQPQQSILESEGTVAGNIRLTCVCYYV